MGGGGGGDWGQNCWGSPREYLGLGCQDTTCSVAVVPYPASVWGLGLSSEESDELLMSTYCKVSGVEGTCHKQCNGLFMFMFVAFTVHQGIMILSLALRCPVSPTAYGNIDKLFCVHMCISIDDHIAL